MRETMLVPLDYTGCAFEVADEAARMAQRLGDRVVLLHVATLPPGVSASAPLHTGGALEGHSMLEALADDAREELERLARVFDGRGVPTSLMVRTGEPASVIVACAEALGASLICMGTHGRTGIARMVLGSVAERVVRHAPCPVMVVRSADQAAHPGPSPVQQQVSAEADG